MNPQPRFAVKAVREEIAAALRDRRRRFVAVHDHASFNYLEKWGIHADTLFADLAADLRKFHLYLKPNTNPQRFQYVLPFLIGGGMREVLIHITLSPLGHPPRVKVALHPHNTGYAPLKRVPIT